MSEPEEQPPLWHQSGVNRDGKPFVQLLLGTKVLCGMTVEQAREHAMAILEAAEASEQDAFLMHFMRNVVKTEDRVAALMLQDFRDWRRKETGKRSGQEIRPDQPPEKS